MNYCSELQNSLAADLGETDVMLTSDMNVATANRLWLKRSFWKKFQDELKPDCDLKALKLFSESNKRCRDFSLVPKSVFEEQVIGEVKSILDDCFYSGPDLRYDLSDLLEGCGTGPGASIGVSPPNFYTKLFDSNLTCTSETLYRFYRYAISSCPTWLSAEEARQQKFGHRIVAGNRLSFAPKTSEISRPICTEPVLNMFLQKGIGAIFEQVLVRSFKINVSTQPEFNRRMARIGSVDGTFGTIDLSSASDSIALSLLKEVLPSKIYNWIDLARSPTVTLPGGVVEELYMVSSMGNGFTFPLETIIFATIVVACYRVLGIQPRYSRKHPSNFAVFGDDIIVRKDAYDFVIRALEMFGFIVNDDKSFNCGHFRESCGGDYFRGHDIRGVYCKSLKTSADVYSIINRLIRWSARTGNLLPSVIRLLLGKVKYLPIPVTDGDAEGIKTPCPPSGLARDPKTGAVKYLALVKQGHSFRMPETDDIDVYYPKALRRRRHNIFYNADGILVALVGGFIRGGRVSLRSERDRFKVRRRMTNSWQVAKRSRTFDLDAWVLNHGKFKLGCLPWRSNSQASHTAGDYYNQDCDWEVVVGLYLS